MSIKQLSNKELWEIRKCFMEYDDDGDGKMSLGEFCDMMKRNNLLQNEALVMKEFRKLDNDNSGEITFNEFLKIYKSLCGTKEHSSKKDSQPPNELFKIRKCFMEYDDDGDGKMSLREFLDMMRRNKLDVNEKHIIKEFKKIDSDKSGEITFNEFVQIYKSMLQQQASQNSNENNEHGSRKASQPANELFKIRKCFMEYDDDGDGKMSLREFLDMMRRNKLDVDEKHIIREFKKIDSDNSGEITFNEFVKIYKSMLQQQATHYANENNGDVSRKDSQPANELFKIRKCFMEYDDDGDGKMSLGEFLDMMRRNNLYVNEKHIIKEFKKLDSDKSGEITFNEFVKIYKSLLPEQLNQNGSEVNERALKPNSRPSSKHNRTKSRQDDIIHQSRTSSSPSSSSSENLAEIQKCFMEYNEDGKRKKSYSSHGKLRQKVAKSPQRSPRTNRGGSTSTLGGNKPTEVLNCLNVPSQPRRRSSTSEIAVKTKQISNHLELPYPARRMSDVGIDVKERRQLKNGPDMTHLSSSRVSKASSEDKNMHLIPAEVATPQPRRRRSIWEKNVEESGKVFWENDFDGDGRLSLEEFSSMIRSLGMRLNEREVLAAFKLTDKNGDGYISFQEFVEVYVTRGSDRARAIK